MGATPEQTTDMAIRLENVTVSYGQSSPVLEGITLALPHGSHVAIIGPNGAGKTTLFNAILGLVPLSQGSVRLLGGSPRYGRSQVAYIPQRESIDWQFPLCAMDIAMMGRINHIGWRLRPTARDRAAAQAALERVGMWPYRNALISELSGGQQQRLVIARALAHEAPILLLDEPFNEVDVATQQLLLTLFDELVALGRTLLVTTHDLELARARFPTLLFLNRTITGFGPTAEVFTPEILQETYLKQVVKWGKKGDLESLIDDHSFSHNH